MIIRYDQLQKLAQEHQLFCSGVVALPLQLEKTKLQLEYWQQQGFAGEMDYMNRSADLLTDPTALHTELNSIISFASFYSSFKTPECPPGFGRIARYAIGRDYHRVLKRKLKKLAERIQDLLDQPVSFRVVTDSIPLLERKLAELAQIGFFGKNTMLIRPGQGSFFFLAEILSNLTVVDVPQASRTGHCGSCSRCISSCPTSAFSKDYVLDARKCISYITIEKKTALSDWERKAVGEWLFGCDICQEVCPFNHRSLKESRPAEIQDFESRYQELGLLKLEKILDLSNKEDFTNMFAGTPIMRAKREGLVRNALCVAANTGAGFLWDLVYRRFKEDVSEVIRQHALWCLYQFVDQWNLKPARVLNSLFNYARLDSSEAVKNEAVRISEAFY